MKVAIIDDELDICIILKFMLGREGHEVHTFTSAELAQNFLKTNDVDIIVCDYHMKKISGYELFQLMKKENKSIPFILLTGESLTNTQQLIDDGIHQVLFKPQGLDELVKVLKELN